MIRTLGIEIYFYCILGGEFGFYHFEDIGHDWEADTPSEGDVGECPDAELEDELHGVAHEDFILDGR